MAHNDQFLGIRLPRALKEGLDDMYPEVAERNNVIRVLIKKLLARDIIVKSHEIEVVNQ